MQLKVGSYPFPVNGVQIMSVVSPRLADSMIPVAFQTRLSVSGFLEGTSQSDLTTKQAALEAVLRIQGQDIVFLMDDGTESATKLKNSGSVSWSIIDRGPTFDGQNGAEYCNQRKFSCEAFVEKAAKTSNQLMKFTETLTFSGGGPTYIHRNAINGVPQKQMIYPATVYCLTQEGSAFGYSGYPTTPGPVVDIRNLMGAPTKKKLTPRKLGHGFIEFGVTWIYNFESITPLSALPTLWNG